MKLTKENVYFVLIIILTFFALKYLSKFFNLFGSPPGSIVGGSSQGAEPNKQNLSYTEDEFKIMADQIETAVWENFGGFTEQDTLISGILMLCQNTDDFLQLSKTYGIRGRGLVIPEYYNLVETITKFLDDSEKESVNEYFQQQGINIFFSI